MAEQPDGEGAAYTRGRIDGEVASALQRHENHFTRINGSLDKMAESLAHQGREVSAQLAVQSLAIQRLADLGDAREKTVKETAAALKVADDQRRSASETRARPIATTTMIIGVAIAGLSLILSVWLARG